MTTSSLSEEAPEAKLARMLLLAKKDIFPTKTFEKCGKSFDYTSYLNWTTSTAVSSEPKEKSNLSVYFVKQQSAVRLVRPRTSRIIWNSSIKQTND